MNKNVQRGLAMVGAFAVASGAQAAAIDVTAVTTGISEAGTAVTAVIMALLALSTGIFGVAKIQKFVSRKAGA